MRTKLVGQTLLSALRRTAPPILKLTGYARDYSCGRHFAGWNFRLGLRFDQVLCDAAEEELDLAAGDCRWQRIAKVVLMGMILGRVVAALFAFGDDVVLECDAVLVRLRDHQLAPTPGQMHTDGKL